MKTALTILFLAATATAASAQSGYSGSLYGSSRSSGYGTGSNPNSHYVAPSIDRTGEYRGGHYRTNPNSTTSDNYGASGNFNPHTGTTSGRRANPW